MKKRLPNAIQYPAEDLTPIAKNDFIGFEFEGHPFISNMSGEYNFQNIAAAFAVGNHFKIGNNQIAKAIEDYKPDNWRSQVIKKSDITIILDAYNANPDSMRAALQSFSKKEGLKAVILGDMLELETPAQSHEQLGELIFDMKMDKVLLVGEHMASAKNKLPMSHHFPDAEFVMQQDWKGYNVLLKGSRKMKLEELVDQIN